MSGEVMLRGLVLVLFSPVIVAAVAYDPGFSFYLSFFFKIF